MMNGQPSNLTLVDLFPSELLPWGNAFSAPTGGAALSGQAMNPFAASSLLFATPAATTTPAAAPSRTRNADQTSTTATPSAASDDLDDHDDQDHDESGAHQTTTSKKRAGRKPTSGEPSDRRKAQNRAAQRAFRERKERYIRELETRVKELEDLTKVTDAATLQLENAQLRALVQKLEAENYYLKFHAASFTGNGDTDPALFGATNAMAAAMGIASSAGGGAGSLPVSDLSALPTTGMAASSRVNPGAALTVLPAQQSRAAEQLAAYKLPHEILQQQQQQQSSLSPSPAFTSTPSPASASVSGTRIPTGLFPPDAAALGGQQALFGDAFGMGGFGGAEDSAMATYMDMAQSLGLAPTASPKSGAITGMYNGFGGAATTSSPGTGIVDLAAFLSAVPSGNGGGTGAPDVPDVDMDLLFNASEFLDFATLAESSSSLAMGPTGTTSVPQYPQEQQARGFAKGEDACTDATDELHQAAVGAESVEQLRAKQRGRLYAYLEPKPVDSSATAQWKAAVTAYITDGLINVDELCELMTMSATCEVKRKLILERVQMRYLAGVSQVQQ